MIRPATFHRVLGLVALSCALPALSLAAQTTQRCPATTGTPMPLKYVGGTTVAAITPCDLMTRLYIFADDSMMGRQVGTKYNDMGTDYIEHEVRRLGLVPGGQDGGYFQKVPVFEREFDPTSTLTVAGQTFKGGTDFTATINGTSASLKDLPVVFGGTALDTTHILPKDAVAGKVLVLVTGAQAPRFRSLTPGLRAYLDSQAEAAAVVTIVGDALPTRRGFGGRPSYLDPESPEPATASGGPRVTVTTAVGAALLGVAPASAALGAAGKPVSMDLRFTQAPLPGRNVVAILRGSDPKLKGEYILIGAHNDHVGFRQGGLPHDSVKAFNMVFRQQGADSRGMGTPSEAQWAEINGKIDSMRKIHPMRIDSISNGADDDGSGSVTLLELAEAFAKAPTAPKRSMIFIWHAGEEAGLWGSKYFSDHPSVPRDSIVGAINIDMVGRGAATDVTGTTSDGTLIHGGPGYVQSVGARRLSTELGDLSEAVNLRGKHGLTIDYALDADGHPQNIYCRSDHYEYARYSIPVVFFTTGGHADYHQVTDEPQYIQYGHMAQIGNYLFDLGQTMANLDHRLVVDKARPDPFGSCKQ
ncbi:MAG TPA: M28 family peptidase [Gemmatimonadales bacterium]|nr:M28 family peptidase [Gemmatimonadales bacterium]